MNNKPRVNVRSFSTAPQLIQLSNFAPANVTLSFESGDLRVLGFSDEEVMAVGARIGIEFSIASVEGFLQGLKISDPRMQEVAFQKSGKESKSAAKGLEVDPAGDIFFLGKRLQRCSMAHKALIEYSIWVKLFCDATSREALLWTGDAEITHNLGKFDAKPGKTTLPKQVFVRILTEIREELRSENPVCRRLQQIYAELMTNRFAENYWYLDEEQRRNASAIEVPGQVFL